MISSYIHRFWRLEHSIFGWASLKILPTTGILIHHSVVAKKAVQPVKIQVTVVWEQQEVVITGTHLTMVCLPYHLMFLFSPSSRRLRMSRNCYGQKLRKSGKIFIQSQWRMRKYTDQGNTGLLGTLRLGIRNLAYLKDSQNGSGFQKSQSTLCVIDIR